jgi:glycine hydroxymethyltransferase
MGEAEMGLIADWIDEGIEAAKREDEAALERLAGRVKELASRFPIPGVTV